MAVVELDHMSSLSSSLFVSSTRIAYNRSWISERPFQVEGPKMPPRLRWIEQWVIETQPFSYAEHWTLRQQSKIREMVGWPQKLYNSYPSDVGGECRHCELVDRLIGPPTANNYQLPHNGWSSCMLEMNILSSPQIMQTGRGFVYWLAK